MSFYGKVIQDLTNSWRGFLLGNKDKKGETFPSDAAVVDGPRAIKFEAKTLHDEGRIASGNRWIQFTTDGEDNTCNIYHGPAGGTKTTDIKGIANIGSVVTNQGTRDEYEKNNKVLKFGSLIDFPNIKYDAAGHIVSTDTTTYLMPQEPDVVRLDREVEELNNTVGLPPYDDPENKNDQVVPDRNLLRRVERLEYLAEITKLLAGLVTRYEYKEPTYPEESGGEFTPPDVSTQGKQPIEWTKDSPSLKDEVANLRADVGSHKTAQAAMSNTNIVEFLTGQNEQGNPISDNELGISEMRALSNPVNATFPSLVGRLTELDKDINPLMDLNRMTNNITYNQEHPSQGFIIGALNNLYKKVQKQIQDLTENFQGTVDDSTNAAAASALAILQIGFDQSYSPDGDTKFSIKYMLDVLKNVLGSEYDFMVKAYGGQSIADRLKAIETSISTGDSGITTQLQTLQQTVTTNETDIEGKHSALSTRVDGINTSLTSEIQTRTELSATVTTLSDLVGTRDNTIMQTQSVIEALKAEHDDLGTTKETMNSIKTDLTTLSNLVGEDDQKGQSVIQRLTTLETTSGSQSGSITDATGQISTNRQNIEQLQTKVESMQETLTTASSTNSTQDEQISSLTSKLENLIQTVNGGGEEDGGLVKSVNDNTDKISEHDGSITDLSNNYTSLQNDISNAKGDIQTLKTYVGSTDGDGLGLRIKTLEDKVDGIDTKVQGFETRITKIETLLTEKYPEDFPGE